MRSFILCLAALSTALALAGCYEKETDASLASAPDYSPNYGYIKRVSENGRTKRVLVPDACLTPDAQSPADDGEGSRLPPGCANNYNLQRMVERKSDLTHGRPLGRAPAAPAARAAQDYLDGKDDRTLGGGVSKSEPKDRPTVTNEPER